MGYGEVWGRESVYVRLWCSWPSGLPKPTGGPRPCRGAAAGLVSMLLLHPLPPLLPPPPPLLQQVNVGMGWGRESRGWDELTVDLSTNSRQAPDNSRGCSSRISCLQAPTSPAKPARNRRTASRDPGRGSSEELLRINSGMLCRFRINRVWRMRCCFACGNAVGSSEH